ncbi:hypothetical protein SBOR_5774 [Sclerotinia borealis F-4128]|uniref:Uncharacterized protein n=1 Tax=Sclerotinia borealis (strain F-4128) TaxID=1432307 RepID=W9CDC8_SCLBF|nr:hypothetical protein SBOR_5774 [Sclerotinia borealis F-4128]
MEYLNPAEKKEFLELWKIPKNRSDSVMSRKMIERAEAGEDGIKKKHARSRFDVDHMHDVIKAYKKTPEAKELREREMKERRQNRDDRRTAKKAKKKAERDRKKAEKPKGLEEGDKKPEKDDKKVEDDKKADGNDKKAEDEK